MVLQVQGRIMVKMPETLEEFFEAFPEIGKANAELTSIEHTKMWRDKVLFIRQRQQATSDYRENKNIRWLGSHAALTCHIAVMRHLVTGVVSLGHFDNFCCWQKFGEKSSAHKEGIKTMLNEISDLSDGNSDSGLVQVSVIGGYTDERGDAAKNSLTLLRTLHEEPRVMELRHFCVGTYNTVRAESDYKYGTPTMAILKGIAIDLETQELFPAVFAWGQYDDFKEQIRQIFKRKLQTDNERVESQTAASTFKVKSLSHRRGKKEPKNKPEVSEQ